MEMCRARRNGVTCGRPAHPADGLDAVHRAEIPVDEENPDAGMRVVAWREAERVSHPRRGARRI